MNHRYRFPFRLLPLGLVVSTALVLAPRAALAQAAHESDAAEDLAALPLESLMDVAVVTSASRFAQRVSDAPSAVSVLTSQDVREHGWRTLADALASLPGLYVSNDRNYAYLGARGFFRPGDYNGRFLLLIDGVRVNDSVYDQASIGTEAMLDMDLVERIEYVPGPGAAVYGSNTLFGVINVVTKSGSALAGPQAALAAGSAGERRGRASYGFHAQDGTDVLLSVSGYTRRGGDLYAAEFDSPDQNDGVAAGRDGDRSRSAFVKVSRGGFAFAAGYVNRVKQIPTASWGAVYNAMNYTRDAQAFASLAYSTALADDLTATARMEWGRVDYQGDGLYPDDGGSARRNVDGAHGAWHGVNANAAYTGLAGHKLLVGVDLQRNARRDQYNFDLDPYEVKLDDRRADSRAGVYVEDEIHLAPTLILNAGARYDHDSTAGGRVNPRAALIWQRSRDTFKLIYGTAYRSPNAYELYYAAEGYAAVQPDLRAEEIATSELVWERRPDAYSKLSLAAFHYRITDLISEIARPDGLLMFDNTARASADGVDLAGERLFAGGTRIRGSYTYQRARDDSGAWLTSSPRHLLKMNATWALPGGALRLGTEGQCVSRQLTGQADTGGYCTWNLTLGPARRRGALDWSVSVYNAAGKAAADPAGPAFVQQAIARAGRTVMTKIGYAF